MDTVVLNRLLLQKVLKELLFPVNRKEQWKKKEWKKVLNYYNR